MSIFDLKIASSFLNFRVTRIFRHLYRCPCCTDCWIGCLQSSAAHPLQWSTDTGHYVGVIFCTVRCSVAVQL